MNAAEALAETQGVRRTGRPLRPDRQQRRPTSRPSGMVTAESDAVWNLLCQSTNHGPREKDQ